MGNTTDTIKKGLKDAAGAVKRGAEKGKDAAIRAVDKGEGRHGTRRGESEGYNRPGRRDGQGCLEGPATPRGLAGPSPGCCPHGVSV